MHLTAPGRPSRLIAGAALVVCTGLLGGCGSSSSSRTGPDPAQVTPASAPIYVGLAVRPSGAVADAARALARTLPQADLDAHGKAISEIIA